MMTKKILSTDLESEGLLYNTKSDEVHILNKTARLIYRLKRDGKNNIEIEKTVRKTFKIDVDQNIDSDIRKCLNDLAEKGLLEPEDT